MIELDKEQLALRDKLKETTDTLHSDLESLG
jgi:hypothetical protein